MNWMSADYLGHIMHLLAFAGAVVTAVRWRRLPKAFRLAGIFLAFGGGSQAVAHYLARTYGNNLEWYFGVMLVNIALIAALFIALYPHSRRYRFVVLAVMAVPFVGALLLFPPAIAAKDFPAKAVITLQVAVTAVSLYYLRQWLDAVGRTGAPPNGMAEALLAGSFLLYHFISFAHWAMVLLIIDHLTAHAYTLQWINVLLIILFYAGLLTALLRAKPAPAPAPPLP